MMPGVPPAHTSQGVWGAAYGIRPSDGQSRLVMSQTTGSGAAHYQLAAAERLGPEALVLAPLNQPQTLLRLDRRTLERSTFGPAYSESPAVVGIRCLARLDAGSLAALSVVNEGSAVFRIDRIDAATGARSVLSGSAVGTGPALRYSTDGRQLLAAQPGGKLFLRQQGATSGTFQLIEIDPATGNRTLLYEQASGTPAGNPFTGSSGEIVADADGRVYCWSGGGGQGTELWRYDPGEGGGEFAPFSGASAGGGAGTGKFTLAAASPDGRHLMGLESSLEDLVWIDRATGERRMVEYPRPLTGDAPPLTEFLPWSSLLFDVPGSGFVVY
ncbi:MAG: hypothetical protein SF028_14790 [Candidatus Sumerlaeia bacterium]|nr:hypothetical protein [Candidatus Sumerlaeia bacterium]